MPSYLILFLGAFCSLLANSVAYINSAKPPSFYIPRLATALLQNLNEYETNPHQSKRPAFESCQFLEEETARVFQLYMKAQAERKYYQQLDANQLQDSFHTTESSAEHFQGWSCEVREEMVAEDKRLYEEWRSIATQFKDEEMVEEVIEQEQEPLPFYLPSTSTPTPPRFVTLSAVDVENSSAYLKVL